MTKLKTKIVTQLQNSKYDKTLKLKLWQKSETKHCEKTQIMKKSQKLNW